MSQLILDACKIPLVFRDEKKSETEWLLAFWNKIQTQKGSNERLSILTWTQYANFGGNPLCQATKQHLNNR